MADLQKTIGMLQLEPIEAATLENRFIPLLLHLQYRTKRIALFFHGSRVIITVGSLIVPALMSIQGIGGIYAGTATYWITWTISLCVTICNALLTLFKLDKRYYYLHTCLEQLISEGWQYIELSGKYSGFNTPEVKPTHTNQFVYFSHAVEKIRMRQVEEEYFKLIEPTAPPHTKHQTKIDSLLPPTPLKEEYKRLLHVAVESSNRIVDGGSRSNGKAENNTETKAESKESETDRIAGAMPVPPGV
jgi:hypothetical protein